MPVSSFMSVDLPAPFSPTRARTSPLRRSSRIPDRAFTPGNVLVTPSACSSRSASYDPAGDSFAGTGTVALLSGDLARLGNRVHMKTISDRNRMGTGPVNPHRHRYEIVIKRLWRI